MSTDALIWWIYGALALGFLLLFPAHECVWQYRCWQEKRRAPKIHAEFERSVVERGMVNALTSADRDWLREQGWRG